MPNTLDAQVAIPISIKLGDGYPRVCGACRWRGKATDEGIKCILFKKRLKNPAVGILSRCQECLDREIKKDDQ